MSLMKICVLSGSRAEFGQLKPLLYRLKNDHFFDLRFVITGSHINAEGMCCSEEIIDSGIDIDKVLPIKSIDDNSRKGISIQIGELVQSFSEYFTQYRPDVLLIIGDRYEMFAASIAAVNLLIPIIHLCGGSTTSGAIDEVYRHSISKMSSIHFTTCDVYRKRVIQLGENPTNVYNVGSLAIENCLNVQLLTEEELRRDLGLDFDDEYCVVTYHPVTLELDTELDEMSNLVDALESLTKLSYIVTLSNIDSGGKRINEIWEKLSKINRKFHVFSSLGMRRYLSALKYSKMMIGNSSSGTTEGPAMGIPVINIGDRQKGRLFSSSTIHCTPKKIDIMEAVLKAYSSDYQKFAKISQSPFGNGNTSELIVDILKQRFIEGISVKKDFYDIDFEVK